jgi:hypothetical protein
MASQTVITASTPAATRPAQEVSAVPERFRSISAPEPGQSAVPPHFRTVTEPNEQTPAEDAKPKTTASIVR